MADFNDQEFQQILNQIRNPAPEPPGRLRTAATNLSESFGRMFGDIPRAAAGAAYHLQNQGLLPGPKTYAPLEHTAGAKLMEPAARAIEAPFMGGPKNPEYRGEFMTETLPSALGSGLAFAAQGLLPGSMAARLARVGTSGAAVGGMQGQRDAAAHTDDVDIQAKSFAANFGLGLTEMAPIAGLLRRMDRVTGGQFGPQFFTRANMKRLAKDAGAEALEEAIQETVQNLGANAVARALYDQDRELLDHVPEGAAAGGIVGALLGGLSSALGLSKATRRARQLDESQESQESQVTPALPPPQGEAAGQPGAAVIPALPPPSGPATGAVNAIFGEPPPSGPGPLPARRVEPSSGSVGRLLEGEVLPRRPEDPKETARQSETIEGEIVEQTVAPGQDTTPTAPPRPEKAAEEIPISGTDVLRDETGEIVRAPKTQNPQRTLAGVVGKENIQQWTAVRDSDGSWVFEPQDKTPARTDAGVIGAPHGGPDAVTEGGETTRPDVDTTTATGPYQLAEAEVGAKNGNPIRSRHAAERIAGENPELTLTEVRHNGKPAWVLRPQERVDASAPGTDRPTDSPADAGSPGPQPAGGLRAGTDGGAVDGSAGPEQTAAPAGPGPVRGTPVAPDGAESLSPDVPGPSAGGTGLPPGQGGTGSLPAETAVLRDLRAGVGGTAPGTPGQPAGPGAGADAGYLTAPDGSVVRYQGRTNPEGYLRQRAGEQALDEYTPQPHPEGGWVFARKEAVDADQAVPADSPAAPAVEPGLAETAGRDDAGVSQAGAAQPQADSAGSAGVDGGPVGSDAVPVKETPKQRHAREKKVAPESDSLLAAIAKLGGISREDAERNGFDSGDLKTRGWKIKPVFNRKGRGFDDMARALAEHGYPVTNEQGEYEPDLLMEAIREEIGGSKVYTPVSREAQLEAEMAEREDDPFGIMDDPGDLLDESEYSEQADDTGRRLQELAEVAETIEEGAAERLLERDVPDGQLIEELEAFIHGQAGETGAGSDTQAQDERQTGEVQAETEEDFALAGETEQDIRDREKARAESEKAQTEANRGAEQKAAADREVAEFDLTGQGHSNDAVASRMGDLLDAREADLTARLDALRKGQTGKLNDITGAVGEALTELGLEAQLVVVRGARFILNGLTTAKAWREAMQGEYGVHIAPLLDGIREQSRRYLADLKKTHAAPSVTAREVVPAIPGTGSRGELTVKDVAAWFDNAYFIKHGKRGDPTAPEAMAEATRMATSEVRYQLQQAKTGVGWYNVDVADAFAAAAQIVPRLGNDHDLRIIMTAIAASTSYNMRAPQNWANATRIIEHYEQTGTFPERKPDTGKFWAGTTGPNMAKQIRLIDHIVKTKGEAGAAEWFIGLHPVSELREAQKASGVYASPTVKGKADELKHGFKILGEKGGAFALNLNGVRETTADKWFTRTWNRHFGTLTHGPVSEQGSVDAPRNETERGLMKQWNRAVAKATGLNEEDAQAVLWYYEQQLYYALGVTSAKSESFSDGAKKLLKDRGIDFVVPSERPDGNPADATAPPPGEAGRGKKKGKYKRTAAFEKWFGGSKVVDDNGDPLVVYHGTGAPEFMTEGATWNTAPSTAKKSQYQLMLGAHFTADPGQASTYARKAKGATGTSRLKTSASGGVAPVYLSLQNPLDLTSYERIPQNAWDQLDARDAAALKKIHQRYRQFDKSGNVDYLFTLEELLEKKSPAAARALVEKLGYDGIIYKAQYAADPGFKREDKSYIAFRPEQIRSALDRDSVFKRAQGETRGLDAATLADHLGKLAGNWSGKPRIHTLQSESDLPARLQAQIRADNAMGEVEAIWDEKTRSAYLIADNIKSPEDAENALAHELFGHYGLREILGKRLDTVLDEIYASTGGQAGNAALIETYFPGNTFDPKNAEHRRTVAEERLAHLAPDNARPGLLKRAYARIREWLRQAGFVRTWTDNDIASLLGRARERVEQGDTATDTDVSDESGARYGKHSKAISELNRLYRVATSEQGLFIRWSAGETVDKKQKVSRDHLKSETHGGLSAVAVDPGWSRGEFAKALKEYGFTRLKTPDASAIIYRARRVGRDSDGYDLIADIEQVDKVGPALLDALDKGLAETLNAQEEVADIESRLPNVTDPIAKKILEDRLAELRGPADVRYSRRPRTGARAKINPDTKPGLVDKLAQTATRGWWKHVADEIVQGSVDKYHYLREAVKEVHGALQPAEVDAYVAARESEGAAAILRGALLHGTPWQNRRTGIVERRANSEGLFDALGGVREELDEFLDYVVGVRAERLMREGRENNFTRGEVAELLALKTPERAQRFDDALRRLDKWNGEILDFAEQSGLIDPAGRRLWEHGAYIPFHRVLNDGEVHRPASKADLSHQWSGIQRLRGSDKAIGDPLQNLISNAHRLINASIKNDAMRKVATSLGGTKLESIPGVEFSPENIPGSSIKAHLRDQMIGDFMAGGASRTDAEQAARAFLDLMPQTALKGFHTLWSTRPPAGDDIVRVMEQGKPKYYRVADPDLMRSLANIHDTPIRGWAMDIARGAKTLLTGSVTATPGFIIRNFERDALHSWVIGKDRHLPFHGAFRGAVKAYNESGGAETLLFSGNSFMAGHVNAHDPNAMGRYIRSAMREKGIKPEIWGDIRDTLVYDAGKLWDSYRKFGNAAENANREAVFEEVLARTGSVAEAAYAARDLMDFSMRGDWQAMRLLTDTIPFLNARLVGMYKLGRATREDWMSVAARGLMITAASAALLAWNYGDDRYHELEDWDKHSFWHFFGPEGSDLHLRLPKPFEVGLVFGTLPDATWETVFGSETGRYWRDMLVFGLTQTLAVDAPQIVKPALEVKQNKNAFTGRPIESPFDRRPKDLRYTQRTSDTTRLLGSIPVFGKPLAERINLSPQQMEHLWRGYLGEIGLLALRGSDLVVRQAVGAPDKPWPRADQLPVLGAVYKSAPPYNTKYSTRVYEMAQEAEKAYARVKSLLEAGDKRGAREQQAAFAPKLAARKGLNAVRRELTQIRKRKDRVLTSDMGRAEKRSALDKLEVMENRLTERAAKRFGPAFGR